MMTTVLGTLYLTIRLWWLWFILLGPALVIISMAERAAGQILCDWRFIGIRRSLFGLNAAQILANNNARLSLSAAVAAKWYRGDAAGWKR